LEPPAWPPDQLLACCCGAARCGAARTGAAARSLFGGASSAMACPMTINVESTPTPQISNFLMTPPRPPAATLWHVGSIRHRGQQIRGARPVGNGRFLVQCCPPVTACKGGVPRGHDGSRCRAGDLHWGRLIARAHGFGRRLPRSLAENVGLVADARGPISVGNDLSELRVSGDRSGSLCSPR
jgi:hypothetical protein